MRKKMNNYFIFYSLVILFIENAIKDKKNLEIFWEENN